jgi:hypothetical protein
LGAGRGRGNDNCSPTTASQIFTRSSIGSQKSSFFSPPSAERKELSAHRIRKQVEVMAKTKPINDGEGLFWASFIKK